MTKHTIALILALTVNCIYGEDNTQRKLYSPNQKELIWIKDIDLNEGTSRRVVSLLTLEQTHALVGFVSEPRHTEVFWNSESTRCAIVDAPDNGNIFVYIFTKSKEAWSMRKVNPFTDLEKKFYAHFKNKEVVSPWRGAVSCIKWLSESKFKITIEDGLGVHEVIEVMK